MYRHHQKNSAFTLVEILIAAGVLSIFLTGVFAFYRMGSRMFVAGSWRLQKQKEAERFLNLLKERIEQASNATGINPSADPQLVVVNAPFVTVRNNTYVANPVADTRLMLFSVCKPDMTRFGTAPGVPGQGPGLILYHCLLARPDEKNLYTLFLHASKTTSAFNGIDFFNSSAVFAPDKSKFSPPLGDFSADPKAFSLMSAPFLTSLTDVVAASFTVEIASGTDGLMETEKVVGISVKMQHPRYVDTTVSQTMKAKIDFSVPLDVKDLGAF